MPRRKVSTLLDDHLFRRAKLESIRRRKQVSEILGEALEQYLAGPGGGAATTGVVAGSWGVLRLDRRKLDRMLDDVDALLDA